MTNKELFRKLINELALELAGDSEHFLINERVASKAGFPDGTELFTPVGKIVIKYTDKSIIGFETKVKKKVKLKKVS